MNIQVNHMYKGCTTALVTPFKDEKMDVEGLERLIQFQKECGINGILLSGTTGESPTIRHDEAERLLKVLSENSSGIVPLVGTGGNSFEKSFETTRTAYDTGIRNALLVDPYYNGPSSLEIRREYISPLAGAFPDMDFLPYVIPGRTGTQLLPQDLALLNDMHGNINAVKEATGSVDNMRLTRRLCGKDFEILSGDDDKTFEMMTDPQIGACGVVSVASNVFPGELSRMTNALLNGRVDEARVINDSLKPIFGIIAIKTEEETPHGKTVFKARNPLPMKTLMNILGMPVGECRRPLGKLTKNAIDRLVVACKRSMELNRDMFGPIENHFGIDVEERLNNEKFLEGLYYETY
jgi:4-hydroxy-tetrahydrodipicolinate synthase